MEKRVLFRSGWLPWVLLAPQLAVITVFFFWPASQALLQSLQMQDAFGTSTDWVGLQNFRQLFTDEAYLDSFKTTAWFSLLVAALGISISLVLAVFADRIVRGAMFYKTFLLLPYAVAPAVAGVLWMFMFSPSLGVVAYMLRQSGFDWNHMLEELGVEARSLSPLRVSYRSTAEITTFARSVLGPFAHEAEPIATRHGPPVELFTFASPGEAVLPRVVRTTG